MEEKNFNGNKNGFQLKIPSILLKEPAVKDQTKTTKNKNEWSKSKVDRTINEGEIFSDGSFGINKNNDKKSENGLNRMMNEFPVKSYGFLSLPDLITCSDPDDQFLEQNLNETKFFGENQDSLFMSNEEKRNEKNFEGQSQPNSISDFDMNRTPANRRNPVARPLPAPISPLNNVTTSSNFLANVGALSGTNSIITADPMYSAITKSNISLPSSTVTPSQNPTDLGSDPLFSSMNSQLQLQSSVFPSVTNQNQPDLSSDPLFSAMNPQPEVQSPISPPVPVADSPNFSSDPMFMAMNPQPQVQITPPNVEYPSTVLSTREKSTTEKQLILANNISNKGRNLPPVQSPNTLDDYEQPFVSSYQNKNRPVAKSIAPTKEQEIQIPIEFKAKKEKDPSNVGFKIPIADETIKHPNSKANSIGIEIGSSSSVNKKNNSNPFSALKTTSGQKLSGIEIAKEKPSEPAVDPSHVATIPKIYDYSRLLELEQTKTPLDLLKESYLESVKLYLLDYVLFVGTISCKIIEVEIYKYPDPFISLMPCGRFPSGWDPEFFTYDHFYFARKFNKKKNQIAILNNSNGFFGITMGEPNSPGIMIVRSIKLLNQKEESKKVKSSSFGIEVSSKRSFTGVIEGPDEVLNFFEKTLNLTVKDLECQFREEAKKQNPNGDTISWKSVENNEAFPLRLVKQSKEENQLSDIFNCPKIYPSPRISIDMHKIFKCVLDPAQIVGSIFPCRFSTCPGDLKQGKYLFATQAEVDGVPDGKIKRDMNLDGDILGRWRGMYLKGETLSREFFLKEKENDHKETQYHLHGLGFLRKYLG